MGGSAPRSAMCGRTGRDQPDEVLRRADMVVEAAGTALQRTGLLARQLVMELTENAIVRGIVNLGRALGLQTTAEGVEEPAQAQILRDLGCDAAQGYLFAPPLPIGELLPALS